MLFIIIVSFIVLLTHNISASITIPNGSHSGRTITLIEQAASDYFKPLTDHRATIARKARLQHFDHHKVKPTTTPQNISELEKHAEKKDAIKLFCVNYCDYILKDREKNKCTSIEDLLKNPLSCFWNINSINVFCRFNDFLHELSNNKISLQNSLQQIKIRNNQSNGHIKESIDTSMNEYNQEWEVTIKAKHEELYLLIEANKVSEFALPDFSTDCESIPLTICETFFKKTFDSNSCVLDEVFFNSLLNNFKGYIFNKCLNFSTSPFTPNPRTLELFFESIIAHKILFNGCSDYIQSLSSQQYPTNIKAGIKRFILDEALRLYQSWLDGSRNVDNEIILNTMQQNAMTEVSSFYKNTIEQQINASYPNITAEILDHWASLFQTALFNGIDFANYQQLNNTFNRAFEDFDLNNPYYNNQAAINQLVLDTHRMVSQGITPTKFHYLSKLIEKKYYAKKPLFVALMAITGFLLIIVTLKKIRGFY